MDWAIAPETFDAALPPLVIQPLVENAIKHGLGHRREGGRLAIRAGLEGDRLRISVSDSGEGFPIRFQEGTGLGNLRARLEVMFGSAASLDINSTAGGSCVTLDLPFLRSQRASNARVDR